MLKNFEIEKKDYIKEYKTKATFYIHKKTGAKVLHYDCENINASFAIYFKTPVENSTGITHILEHSVFEGSKKYPDGGMLDYLNKNSLANFYNALTYQDMTVYPFCSSYPKDFLNVMDIYLDFVFFPELKNTTFQREGHFLRKKEDGSYEVNGIVFNEMQDSIHSFDHKAYTEIVKHLFPKSSFNHIAGGDPYEITDLTVEKLRQYHKDYYHPSNSHTILYGKINKKKVFEKLDEYFDQFEKRNYPKKYELDFTKEPKKLIEYYQEFDSENLSSYIKAIPFEILEQNEFLSLDFLIDVLLKYKFSPLRRAIEDSKLCNSFSYYFTQEVFGKPFLVLQFKGLKEENIFSLNELLEKSLKKLSKKIDSDIKKTCLRYFEFYIKENSYTDLQGYDWISNSLFSYINDENPVIYFKKNKIYSFLKKFVNGKKLENLISKYFLSQNVSIELTLRPSNELLEIQGKKLNKKLEEKLQNTDLTKLDSEIIKFENWKNSEKKEPKFTTQKIIKLKDLNTSVKKYEIEKNEDILFVPLKTQDITRVKLLFNIEDTSKINFNYLGIYLGVVKSMGTTSLGFEKFDLLRENIFNKFNIGFETNTNALTHEKYNFIKMDLKYLSHDYEKASEILFDFVKNLSFNDKDMIKKVLTKKFHEIKRDLDGFEILGYTTPFVMSKINPWRGIYDQMSGIPFINFLSNLLVDIDKNLDEISIELEKIHSFIFNNPVIISFGSDEEFQNKNLKDLKGLISKLSFKTITKEDLKPFNIKSFDQNFYLPENYYIQVNSDTNFNCMAAKLHSLPEKFNHLSERGLRRSSIRSCISRSCSSR